MAVEVGRHGARPRPARLPAPHRRAPPRSARHVRGPARRVRAGRGLPHGPAGHAARDRPDLVGEVFTTHAARVRKGRILEGARVLLGDGLLTAEGEHHRRQRRLIQPGLPPRAPRRLRGSCRARRETADGWRDGEVVDAFAEMSALTMGVMGEALFGAEVGEDFERVAGGARRRLPRLRPAGAAVLRCADARPDRTVRRFRAAKADLEAMVDEVSPAAGRGRRPG